MSLYKQKGSQVWYYYIKHDGRQVRRSTGTTDRREAQRIEAEAHAALFAQPRRSNEITWQDACVKWLEAEPRSESDCYSLKALNYPDRPLDQCTRESFEEALAGKSPATFNRHRAIIQAILHLSDRNIKIPLKKVAKGRIRFLTKDEWERLYDALPPHLKVMAKFAITTGLRQHNVTHLQWNQLDLPRKVAWVHPDQTKSGNPIGIPLSTEAVVLLRKQIGLHKLWVFPYGGRGRSDGAQGRANKDGQKNDLGGPVTKIKTAWFNAQEKAGLGHFKQWETPDGKKHKQWMGDFTWHGLRHTWASWHVMSGTPLAVLQELGGWEDIRMVQKYAHLAPGHLARYADNAKPWDSQEAVA